jgi:hypothetical protein
MGWPRLTGRPRDVLGLSPSTIVYICTSTLVDKVNVFEAASSARDLDLESSDCASVLTFKQLFGGGIGWMVLSLGIINEYNDMQLPFVVTLSSRAKNNAFRLPVVVAFVATARIVGRRKASMSPTSLSHFVHRPLRLAFAVIERSSALEIACRPVVAVSCERSNAPTYKQPTGMKRPLPYGTRV